VSKCLTPKSRPTAAIATQTRRSPTSPVWLEKTQFGHSGLLRFSPEFHQQRQRPFDSLIDMRFVRSVIIGLIFSGFVIALSGCASGEGVWHRTETRHLPDELRTKLSVGDTRKKVHQVLGEPLLDARKLEVELYRKSGRDIDYMWVWVFYAGVALPAPGQKVIVFVMVSYDERDLVKEITTDFWIPGHSHDYWATAGGYAFVNSYYNEPETILAPPFTWRELTDKPVDGNRCTLVLLMGECPMEQISLDATNIIDLSPAGGWCGWDRWEQREHSLYGAFLKKEIAPGSHNLSIRQKTKKGNFGVNFSCEAGETVIAELQASHTADSTFPNLRLQGEISISKNPIKNPLDIDALHPIIWHQDTWY